MTNFENWWLSLPKDLRVLYGSAAINPARAAFEAAIKFEREECAKVCDEHWRHSGNAMNCADAIRSRGKE